MPRSGLEEVETDVTDVKAATIRLTFSQATRRLDTY